MNTDSSYQMNGWIAIPKTLETDFTKNEPIA
jgi:hypothetical protein